MYTKSGAQRGRRFVRLQLDIFITVIRIAMVQSVLRFNNKSADGEYSAVFMISFKFKAAHYSDDKANKCG